MMENKKVLVFGMARSGIAAARLLLQRGARVWVCDGKAEAEFDGALDGLKADGAVLCLGEKDTHMGKPNLAKLIGIMLTNKAVGE